MYIIIYILHFNHKNNTFNYSKRSIINVRELSIDVFG